MSKYLKTLGQLAKLPAKSLCVLNANLPNKIEHNALPCRRPSRDSAYINCVNCIYSNYEHPNVVKILEEFV